MNLTGSNRRQVLSAPSPYNTQRYAAKRTPGSPVRPAGWEVVGLICINVIAFLGPEVLPVSAYNIFNIVTNFCFGFILIAAAWRMVVANSFSFLTALFWFRIATSIYFAYGTAYVSFADADILDYMRSTYPFTMEDTLRVNQLVVTCTTTVVVTLFAIEPSRPDPYLLPSKENIKKQKTGLSIGIICLLFGSFAHYGFVLPFKLDITDNVYSSLTGNLSRIRLIGIFLIVFYSIKTNNKLLIPITIYVLIDIISSFFTFSKSELIMTQIVYILPFIITKPSRSRFLICSSVLVFTFISMQSILGNLRETSDESSITGFQSRFEIAEAVIFSEKSAAENKSPLDTLARFSFVNSAALVMNQYDEGFASDWPKLIPAVFVPRMIWPGKPSITQIGVDIYALSAGGRTTSSSSAGYFAEAYWAGGWLLSIALSVFLALVLRMLTRLSFRLLYHGRWLQMITVLLAMRIGFRVDGHYIADVFGALVFVGFFLISLTFVEAVLRQKTSGVVLPLKS